MDDPRDEPLPTVSRLVVRDVAVVRGDRRWVACRRDNAEVSVRFQTLADGRSGEDPTDWDRDAAAPGRWQDGAVHPRSLTEDEEIDGYRLLDEIVPADVLAELARGLAGARWRRSFPTAGAP